MPERGQYELTEHSNVAPRTVDSLPRRAGVTFSPSSSRSRLHIVDSGQRYEVRLTSAGLVEIRTDGTNWVALVPSVDPLTGTTPAWGMTYRLRAAGDVLATPDPFDMIAVGRGRILAKARGVDRFYHLVLDELFRSREASGLNGRPKLTSDDPARKEDPPVPSNYFKLDPGYFKPGSDPVVVPEIQRDYAHHPACRRFPLFRVGLQSRQLDGTVVPVRPRVWYEIDSRPPLNIVDPDDLRLLKPEDFLAVLTVSRVKQILNEELGNVQGAIDDFIQTNLNQALDAVFWPTFDELRSFSVSPIWKGFFVAYDAVLKNFVEVQLQQAVRGVEHPPFAATVRDALTQKLAELIVGFARQYGLVGFAQIFLIALGVSLHMLMNPSAWPDGAAIVATGSDVTINLDKIVNLLNGPGGRPMPHRAIQALIQDAMGPARTRRMGTDNSRDLMIPNSPPRVLPSYEHVKYVDSAHNLVEPRLSIDFRLVLDMGVGYSHWSEHWQRAYGGEMHGLLAKRPLAQAEGFNSVLYRFLNGPVLDGDGYVDGTCNFYLFVQLAPVSTVANLATHLPNPGKFAILWIDEQSYFTQRWRLVHPNLDVAGDIFSLQRTLHDTPELFRFDFKRYWSPFDGNQISASSRMAVVRQIIAVTGFEYATNQHEIYTIAFSYGVCDHTWRWRALPVAARLLPSDNVDAPLDPPAAGVAPSVFVNTLALREDATLHLRGYAASSTDKAGVSRGRWFQRYLPADARHVPRSFQLDAGGGKPKRGYTHAWDFVSEEAYQLADRYFQLGAFETVVDARCQYYELDILEVTNPPLTPAESSIDNGVWRNDAAAAPPLRHDTTDFGWTLGEHPDQAVSVRGLIEDRSTLPTMSMYEATTRFVLRERPPLGWIAVFFDKRDDELQPASQLPHEVTFVQELEPTNDPFDGTATTPVRPGPINRIPRRVRAVVKGHRRVIEAPVVRKVIVTRLRKQDQSVGVRVSFFTPRTVDEVAANVWRVCLGALRADGTALRIFDVTCSGSFKRAAVPTAPLPLDFDAEVLTDAWRYDYEYRPSGPNAARDQNDIHELCTREGRIAHFTSVWFEDVVGHLATAEEIELRDAPG